MRRALLGIAVVFVLWLASAPALGEHTLPNDCAFNPISTTYEAPRDRRAYLLGGNLAGFNMIAANDAFFGTSRVENGPRSNRGVVDTPYMPPTLLKAIGFVESNLAQADHSVYWGATGPTKVSFDCGHGIMQITSGMVDPADSGWPSKQQSLVTTHYLYNIARGSAILVDKWNAAPGYRPIAGTDTDSDPAIVENWYFAVWSYNGFTGPGANRSNHPSDPDYAWPRTGFSCGPANDGYGHSYGNYPYQELVFGCATRPPSVDGQQLWPPLELSLPDLDDPTWSEPLDLDNFTTSDWFARMDIPSPQPWHRDPTEKPGDSVAPFLLGAPTLVANRATVADPITEVTISNIGAGILAWRAKPGQSWISVDKQGGVALGPDVPCAEDAPCERSPTLTITVNRDDPTPGWVDIESLTTSQTWRIEVVRNIYDVNCDGTTSSIDALVVLQFSAGQLASLPCEESADVNGDGVVNVLDALLILQFNAGLL